MKIKRYLASWTLLLALFAACTPWGSESPDSSPSDSDNSGQESDSSDETENSDDVPDQDAVGRLITAMTARGFTVAPGDVIEQPFFEVPAQVILLEDEAVQLFLFADEAAAQAAAELVTTDGGAIGTHMVRWAAPPHFFHDNALIAIYAGSSPEIIEALVLEMGEQFAGAEAVAEVDDIPEPPAAYLTIAGNVQAAGIGTYCWGSATGPAVCADMIGIPTQATPLEIQSLALFEFALTVGQAPSQATVSVQPVAAADLLETVSDGWSWWPYGEPASQFSLPLSEEPQIELTLAPGLNVVSLFATWPEYGDVTYGFLVDVKSDGDAGAFWSIAEDPRTGVRFATPCFWRIELPVLDPSGVGAFPVMNYSEALSQRYPRSEGVFAHGGLKIDFIYVRPSQLGLPANTALADVVSPLMGSDIIIEEMNAVVINDQAGLMLATRNPAFDETGRSYLFSVDDDLVLLLGVVPGAAYDHPDIQAIVHSLALSDAVAVRVPETVPAGPPSGDGPFSCMAMGDDKPSDEHSGTSACETAAAAPESLACTIQTALLARDMDTLESLMSDPFTISYWQSEGYSDSPANISKLLSTSHLPADTSGLEFTNDQSKFPSLNGIPVEGIFGPDNEIALIFYSEGWGEANQGAAFLYLTYDELGDLQWAHLLYAGAAFE